MKKHTVIIGADGRCVCCDAEIQPNVKTVKWSSLSDSDKFQTLLALSKGATNG